MLIILIREDVLQYTKSTPGGGNWHLYLYSFLYLYLYSFLYLYLQYTKSTIRAGNWPAGNFAHSRDGYCSTVIIIMSDSRIS